MQALQSGRRIVLFVSPRPAGQLRSDSQSGKRAICELKTLKPQKTQNALSLRNLSTRLMHRYADPGQCRRGSSPGVLFRSYGWIFGLAKF